MIARININVVDVRRDPRHESERVNQGLYNELVEVIEEYADMRRVRFTDTYEGWVGKQFLTPYEGFQGDGPLFVDRHLISAYERPDLGSRRLTFLSYGSLLYGSREDGFLRVNSDRYGEIYIEDSALIDKVKLIAPKDLDSGDLRHEAEKFLGVPYLWGGRSGFGVDCSGFVKAIIGRFGIELPRDTKDQIKSGREVKRDEMKKGDLIFFPRHVALLLDQSLLIHSSRSVGGVAYNSLDPQSPRYRDDLDKSFIAARRIFN